MKEYRDTIRKEATPVTGNYVDHNVQQRGARCGHLETVQLRRACMRNARATIPQGAQREFNKRTSTRDITAQREVCRAKETPLERLQCLRSQHSNSRSRVTRPLRRARLQQKAPVDFISPQGLRRNLSRARDLVKEKCGDIQDGNEKRACMKEVRAKYQGY